MAIKSNSACLWRCDKNSVVFVAACTAAAAAAAAAAACVNDDGNVPFVSLVRRCNFCKKSAEMPLAWAFSKSSWIGNGCDVRIDDTDDVDDDDDDEFAMIWLCKCSDLIWSNSTLIGRPSAADSFSQILAGDQMIAFEFDRFDFIDKFNGSSSSISENLNQKEKYSNQTWINFFLNNWFDHGG